MNIILISDKMAKAKTLSTWQVSLIVAMLIVIPAILTWFIMSQITVLSINTPQITNVVNSSPVDKNKNSQKHLDAYAQQLGELQARIMRLDAQNQQLEKLAGDKVGSTQTTLVKQSEPILAPNRGGPLIHPRHISEQELQQAIQDLVAAVDAKDDYQSVLEAKVLQRSVLKDMLPNVSPVESAYNSSSYGWRIDPFRGVKAFHEGLDFPAATGTPIYAAGDGMVTAAEQTHDYGNIVKINHGSGLETRYAHTSKILVKVGQRVVKGQEIALVGSTGRSTGPHLHYEIRLNGSPLDPRRYLDRNAA
jgi:murein DD-endopeptidase MepM/ murein hydrolase activator NlpD